MQHFPREHFLQRQVGQFRAGGAISVRSYIEALNESSYQGRELGRALQVIDKMHDAPRCTIFLALAGAMVPAGMRTMLVDMIERRLIDGIVSTGANVIHDLVECLGYGHYRIDPEKVDDAVLGEHKLNRVYDTVLPEEGFVNAEHRIIEELAEMDTERTWSSRQFLHELGRRLTAKGAAEGMTTTMAKRGLPLYCPGIADSELGIDMLYARWRGKGKLVVDVIDDIGESADVVWQSHLQGGEVALITVGGGAPRNFFQQTGPALDCAGRPYPGHKYAVGITTDVPFWGGMSGSTFEEAQSWRKYNDPEHATVRADATIVLPMLYAAAVERQDAGHQRPSLPVFDFSGETARVRYE
ncbi:MAG: deoxyhypusine synthase family protein [Chloroflexi bacterium]|nr:deoxyhypusine synthase family protein [Chloroflexota bacterium]